MIYMKNSDITEDYYNHFPLSDYFSFDISPYVSVVRFDNEEAILREGESSDVLYYLIDGRAKLFLSHENGRISLINFLNAPCFIGEMELLGAQEASNGVTAITPCICYAIDIRKCKDKMLNDSRFLRHLCLFLSKKAIGNTYNYSKNQSYTLDVRLANFILLTACNGIYRERHTEVAEFLGVTYRHLLYVFAKFVKQGMLEKSKTGYSVKDYDALRKIAEKS